MSKTDSKKKDPKVEIDSDAVKRLADLFKETDLSEIEYETEGCRIRVARSYSIPAHTQTTLLPPAAAPAPKIEEAPAQAKPEDAASNPGAIKSPMVGTAYLAAQPGSAPFVAVGSAVKEGDTVMIIEAMKVMNPIRAPKSGTVKEVLVQDATPVEFDDPLLIIE